MSSKDPKLRNKLEGLSNRPSLTIDYDLYQHYLDDSDLTDEQKREFLDVLWSIIVSFVDLGFGVHPLQQTTDDTAPINSLVSEFLQSNPTDMVASETAESSVSGEQSGSSSSRKSA